MNMNCLLFARRSGAALVAVRGSLLDRVTSIHTSTANISTRTRARSAESSSRKRHYEYITPLGAYTSQSTTSMYSIPWVLITCFAFSSSILMAETEEKAHIKKQKEHQDHENPLLSGVSEEDIQAFVKQVLADPTMNCKGIPDAVEAELYRLTVRLVLDILYSSISALHGVEFDFLAGHRIELRRRRETADEAAASRWILKENTGIDEAVLEQVADRILQNSAVNFTAVPDILEREIYSNCLKLVFRLLDTLANTFCINICGHELRLHFDPMKIHASNTDTTTGTGTVVPKSRINVELLANQCSRSDYNNANSSSNSSSNGSKSSSSSQSLFQQQVLLSVYTLVLGIFDDVLANSEIKLLHDRVSFVVVADDDDDRSVGHETKRAEPCVTIVKQSSSQSGTAPVSYDYYTASTTFAAGVAVGSALTFFLGARR
jgi:hypothetical protein